MTHSEACVEGNIMDFHATRPLLFEEIQYAAAIDELEPEDEYISKDCLTDKFTIINACVGLVRTNEEDHSIASLVHYTTREFFDHSGSEYISSAKLDVAFACVRFLSLPCFSPDKYHTLGTHSLEPYVWRNLCHHLQDAMESANPRQSEELQRCSMQLFLDTPRISCLSQSNCFRIKQKICGFPRRFRIVGPPSFQASHYASFFGLLWIVPLLVQVYGLESRDDGTGRLPLSFAAESGKDAVAQLLLDYGAQVDCTDNRNRTPLSHAAQWDQVSTVRLLLSHGAQPDWVDYEDLTPLSYAVDSGNVAVVKLLLNHGAKPTVLDENKNTHLGMAAAYGYLDLIPPLLQRGAQLRPQPSKLQQLGGTRLWSSCFCSMALGKMLKHSKT
ncbi:ankyrin repeat-containing domain protein [Aspergillus keveii]|uniref:Ankyrin repeat-containing domain protein n=1 Tax=Aspergillus keveii TaxID=714993 RepID=A0ABR4FJH6_9EURO